MNFKVNSPGDALNLSNLLKDGNWKRVNQSNDGKPLQDLHAKMIKLYKELV